MSSDVGTEGRKLTNNQMDSLDLTGSVLFDEKGKGRGTFSLKQIKVQSKNI